MADDVTKPEVILDVKNLVVVAERSGRPDLPIVKDVSFTVRKGEVVALIGESGSGKTTISLAALGYCRPGLKFTSGSVSLLGRDMLKMSHAELRAIRGNQVAYVAQSAAAAFNPAIRINAQVTEAPVLHGTKTQGQSDDKAFKLYQDLELPDPSRIGARFPHQVSGGQLQRLMAGMALCSEPDLLVLDEPTTALDVTTQIEVLKAFKSVIKKEGAAAIYVTHDLAVVAQIADYIVVLYDGEVKEAGSTDIIINAPQHPYTKRLISAINTMPDPRTLKVRETEDTAADITSVSAGYGGGVGRAPTAMVLHDISLSIPKGRTVGIVGESGCGKSTLARVVAGLLPSSDGTITLNGSRLDRRMEKRSKRELQKIQFVYQMADTALNPRHKIKEILGRPLTFYRDIRGDARRQRVAELLDLVELPAEMAERFPGELSGGQKQRVNLARALAASPEIVLCDEVTSALDTIVSAKVVQLLKSLQQKTGVSFVFISHDLSTVTTFSDVIVVLYAGRVVECGKVPDVLSPPFHPYTRLLISSVPKPEIGWLEYTTQTEQQQSGKEKPVAFVKHGCPFFPRCAMRIPGTCDQLEPPARTGKNGHEIACHRTLPELA